MGSLVEGSGATGTGEVVHPATARAKMLAHKKFDISLFTFQPPALSAPPGRRAHGCLSGQP